LTLCFPIGFHFLAYPNLFGIKGFVVVVVVVGLVDPSEPNSCKYQRTEQLFAVAKSDEIIAVLIAVIYTNSYFL
jgi:hypothetical protein